MILASENGDVALLLLAIFGPSVLVLIGCAFGCRALMLSKGRSGTAGFFMGLCLGVIGVIIAACIGATPEQDARKLRQQMQLMGVAPAPGAGPWIAAGSTAPIYEPPASIPLRIAAIVAWTYPFVAYGLTDRGISEYIVLLYSAVGVFFGVRAIRFHRNDVAVSMPSWWRPAVLTLGVVVGLTLLSLADDLYNGVDALPLATGSALCLTGLLMAHGRLAMMAKMWPYIVIVPVAFFLRNSSGTARVTVAVIAVELVVLGVLGVVLAHAGRAQLAIGAQQPPNTVAAGDVDFRPVSAETVSTSSPSGWKPDPFGRHQHRFHDGKVWSNHVSDDGVAGVDEPMPTPIAPTAATAVLTSPPGLLRPPPSVAPSSTNPDEWWR